MCARSNCLTIASTRLRVSHGGFGSRPAKNMLYSASSCFISALEPLQIAFDCGGSGTCLPLDEEVQQRQPELPRIGHRADRRSAPRCRERTDDFEQVAQPRRIARPETGAVAEGGARCRSREIRPNCAPARARGRTPAVSSGGNTIVIENGRGCAPNSASCRSGSSAASSSSVGCSGDPRTAKTVRADGILAVPRSQLYCRMAPCLEHADRVRAFAGRFVQA